MSSRSTAPTAPTAAGVAAAAVRWPGQPPGTQLACSIERQSVDYAVGLDAQYAANVRRAADEGYFIPNHPTFRFSDNNTSGRREHRQGLDRFRAVVLSPSGAPFVRGYTVERSRAYRHRDPRRLFALELECEEHGVLIRYADEPDPASLDDRGQGDPARIGRFIGSAVKTVMTSEEVDQTLRRTRKGLRWRVMNGYYPCPGAPYGLDRWLVDMRTGEFLELVPPGTRVIRDGCAYRLRWSDGPEREVLVRMFDAADRGVSMRAIAIGLNDDGIPPPSARYPRSRYQAPGTESGDAPRWVAATVGEMLHETLYRGDFLYPFPRPGGERPVAHTKADPSKTNPIVYRDFVPDPPVTRGQWRRVKRALARHPCRGGRKRADPKYLLGSCVVCAHCGARFHGNARRKAGPEHPGYYRHVARDPRLGRPSARTACPFVHRSITAAQLHDAALLFARAALAEGGLHAEAVAEVRRQRALAAGGGAAQAADRLRAAIARHTAAAARSSDNASLAAVDSARALHVESADKHARLADAARLELAAAESATARYAAAEARLASETLGDPAEADALARADLPARRRIIQSVVREVRVDLARMSAVFDVVALA